MRPEADLFLAIDQGGQSTRAVVADTSGRTIAARAHAVATLRTAERVEQQADELFDSVRTCLRDVAHALGEKVSRVDAAGLAAQRSSVVCWDRDSGTPLSPAISWMDRRGAAVIADTGLDTDSVRARTGLHLSPHYGAAKLAWCLRELPAVRRAASNGTLGLGPLSSYLVWRLSRGRVYTVDPTMAQRTLLWDRHSGDWSPELCAAFGIPLESLPVIVGCDAGFGEFQLDGHRVRLRICAGDQGLVISAYGAPDPTTVYVNAGTGAFVLMPLAGEVEPADRGLLQTLSWAGADGRRWIEEGTVNGAASALERLPGDNLPVEPGVEDFFLNGVGGLGSPWWIADYPSRFVGEAATPAARERLVIDSVVHLIVANVQRLRSWPERVLLTGGMAHRADLGRSLADALGLPVGVPADREATVRGILTALEPGTAAHGAQQRCIEPDPAAGARWSARQQRWEELLLAGWY